MTTAAPLAPPAPPPLPIAFPTVADLLDRLGDIPPERVRMTPAPGTATEGDIFAMRAKHGILCELVDGILVEKPMGSPQSLLALSIGYLIIDFVEPRRLGVVLGSDGMVRLFGGRVRMPDVSFLTWGRLPGRKVPTAAVWEVAPDLAVEVLSDSNTRAEMALKRREYFAAGTRLVWQIDPRTRIAEVYTAPDAATAFDATQSLDGGDVLPGFALSLAKLFGKLDEEGPPAA